jgi:hypothetical protein
MREKVIQFILQSGADMAVASTVAGLMIYLIHTLMKTSWFIRPNVFHPGLIILDSMIKGGAHINARTGEGRNPLILAYEARSEFSNQRLIKALPKHGTDVTAKGNRGQAARHILLRCDCFAIR